MIHGDHASPSGKSFSHSGRHRVAQIQNARRDRAKAQGQPRVRATECGSDESGVLSKLEETKAPGVKAAGFSDAAKAMARAHSKKSSRRFKALEKEPPGKADRQNLWHDDATTDPIRFAPSREVSPHVSLSE